MIEFENLTVAHGRRVLVDKASGCFVPGGTTALIGRNGAGKSSLLRVLAGIDRPVAGSVRVCGKDLATMSPAERARTVAFVTTQRVRIANLSCASVVGMGRAPYTDWIGRLSEVDRAAVDEALAAVGMSEYATRTMDTMSDGECQRIMIARALAQSTPILLLDEPTSFLDMPNRYELCSLLARLAHDEHKCILFSTHELDIALRLCDYVALIDKPHLHNLTPAEMIESGHIQRLFNTVSSDFDVRMFLK